MVPVVLAPIGAISIELLFVREDHVVPIAAVGDLLLGKLDALDFVGLGHLGATLTLLVDESIVALE